MPLFQVDKEEVQYVFDTWLNQPYIVVNDPTAFAMQLQKEQNLVPGLDLSLDAFAQSQFYRDRIATSSPDPLTPERLYELALKPWGKVMRPNHGLGHTLRTVAYIPEVVREFQKYHSEYQPLNEKDIRKIQYLALFSIVGRLNECGWADNLATYSYFRWRSGEIFQHYMMEKVDGTPRYKLAGFASEKELVHYKQQLLEMGEPNNIDPIHVILNTSHKIDLMRCSFMANPFVGRFDDYLQDLLPSDAIERLKKLGELFVIRTGERISTGNTPDIDRNREGSLYEPCELDVAHCMQVLNEAYAALDAEIKTNMQPFVAKVTGAYRFNRGNFLNFLDDITKDPLEFRNPKYRPTPRVPTHFTLKGHEIHRIGDKPSQVNKKDKLQSTYITSATYIDPQSKTPVFGHEEEGWRFLVGIGVDPKDVLFNRFIRKDLNTYERPLDYQSYLIAENILKYQNTGNEQYLYDNFDEFAKAVAADSFKNVHNEVMARLRWNCDGSSKIFIFSNALEARLMAKHYASYLTQRIHQHPHVINYNKEYEVPIQFYTPYHATNGQMYTLEMYAKDQEQALNIFSNPKEKGSYYNANNYHFLLGLSARNLQRALNEVINGQPLWVRMIYNSHSFLVDMLFAKFTANEMKAFLGMKAIPFVIKNTSVDHMVRYGYYHNLKVILALQPKEPYIQQNIDALILSAIEHGHADIFHLLKEQFVSHISYGNNVENYLLTAIKHRQLTAFQFLLNEVKLTPKHLLAAVESGDMRLIELIHERKIAYNALDQQGVVALHIAAKQGKNNIVRMILEHQQEPTDINVRDKALKTPLHYAVSAENDHTVSLLLERGADIHAVDSEGKSPLYYGMATENPLICELLMAKNADIFLADAFNKTPMDYAFETFYLNRVQRPTSAFLESLLKMVMHQKFTLDVAKPGVLEFLASYINTIEPLDPLDPYQAEDMVDKMAFITQLSQHLVDTNGRGTNLLFLGAQKGQTALVECFLPLYSTCINNKNIAGDAPLHFAVRSGNHYTVNLLLKQGADPNLTGKYDTCPLAVALGAKNILSFKLLVEYGADYLEFDNWGLQKFIHEDPQYFSRLQGVQEFKRHFLSTAKIETKNPLIQAKNEALTAFFDTAHRLFNAPPLNQALLYVAPSFKELENAFLFTLLAESYGEADRKGSTVVLRQLVDFAEKFPPQVMDDTLCSLIERAKETLHHKTNHMRIFSHSPNPSKESNMVHDLIISYNQKSSTDENIKIREKLMELALGKPENKSDMGVVSSYSG